MTGIRYNEANRLEFGDVELEFRIGVNQGFRELNPLLPEDQGVSLTGSSLAQDIFDITEVNTSLKQTNFVLTEGENVQIYLGLFDPGREQFLTLSQIDRLTTLDITNRSFNMDLKITGFRGDSELIAGDIALLSDREIEAGQRDDAEEFRSENTVLGTPFRTSFRTAGEFALKKLTSSDLTADLIEGDYIGSITGDVSIRSQVTPVEVFSEDNPFGATEFVTQIPSVSIQTVNSNDDPGSTLIQPNANFAEELQKIEFELFITYQLNQNDQIFTELVRGDFNYIDLAAEGTPPTTTPDGDALILGTPGKDVLKGTDANEAFNALAGADTVRAGGGDDTISGRGGADKLFGQAGDDDLSGGGGKDTLKGGGGKDFLAGGGGKDQLIGGGGSDEITGDGGADLLRGGGNDTLAGGKGNDVLTGNNGSDAFLFLGLKGKDVVTDFNKAQDLIIFGAGGDRDDLNLRQAGATLEVRYEKTTVLLRGVDRDDFAEATVLFTDLF